jgi:hypothetical protein
MSTKEGWMRSVNLGFKVQGDRNDESGKVQIVVFQSSRCLSTLWRQNRNKVSPVQSLSSFWKRKDQTRVAKSCIFIAKMPLWYICIAKMPLWYISYQRCHFGIFHTKNATLVYFIPKMPLWYTYFIPKMPLWYTYFIPKMPLWYISYQKCHFGIFHTKNATLVYFIPKMPLWYICTYTKKWHFGVYMCHM